MSEQLPDPQDTLQAADMQQNALVYESNPKHRDPWQPGRKGSICDMQVRPHVLTLLRESEVDGNKRYAVFNGRAYCAQEHSPGTWHGYPVGWREVPARLRQHWMQQGKVSKRLLKLNWEEHQ